MNTVKQLKVFGGFKVTAEGRVLVSDLSLLQDMQKELNPTASYSAAAVGATPAASAHYSSNF